MSTYNLRELKTLLEKTLHPSLSLPTAGLIESALSRAGILPEDTPTLNVELGYGGGKSGSVVHNPELFLETGQGSVGHPVIDDITTTGGSVLATGDGFVDLKVEGSGPNTLVGGAGSESLTVVSGNNVLFAGSGKDSLYGGTGADTLYGGGQSLLIAGTGANILYSSKTGSDTLDGGSGADKLLAQGGNNQLVSGSGLDTLYGGSGLDTLYGAGSGHDTLYGGGTSLLYASTQVGSKGDLLYTSASSTGHDTLYGGTGADKLDARAGNNFLYSGSGLDSLYGGTGNDSLYGSGLQTTLSGVKHEDTLSGGGSSSLYASTMAGSYGDRLQSAAGTSAHDTLYGGSGSDTLISYGGSAGLGAHAQDTADHVQIYLGSDTLAGQGNDSIVGTANSYSDVYVSKIANDTIPYTDTINTAHLGSGAMNIYVEDTHIASMSDKNGVVIIKFTDSKQTLRVNEGTNTSTEIYKGTAGSHTLLFPSQNS